MFDTTETAFAEVNGQLIAYRTLGEGPPVLMLHGYPQTHALWKNVANLLKAEFSLVLADLRGYGDSSKPEGYENYTFREMGKDQLALMSSLGFERFHLVGHDRGARAAHRMALDAPDRIESLTVMDIVPTHHILSNLRKEVAAAYYHWFFLTQPEPAPERMILADPDSYYLSCLTGWGHATAEDFDPDQLSAYRTAWRHPETTRAMCDDYRATLNLDYEHDSADLGRRVTCPTLVLWGQDGVMDRFYDVPATWENRFENMTAKAMPGGHFFIDQHPQETVAALRAFLNKAL
ncbi:haloacetate dehalogenase [Shimia isoporae]|uniref:Haloacetate dehalogenase n=1 Tax=Shimia isoporae TaxID=647720 RepID=A0A4R1NPI5_9RHOB|nr:alpha/beta hydrolase [Shimia isoporae]TCL09759.1 haloacetate dehalogenase [Shimia isoporae]